MVARDLHSGKAQRGTYYLASTPEIGVCKNMRRLADALTPDAWYEGTTLMGATVGSQS